MFTRSAQLRLVKMAQKHLDKNGYNHNKGGSFNCYYKLTESVGIKARYGDIDDKTMLNVIEIYERAKLAHSIGCGPYVFGLFYHPKCGLCYLVQVVKVLRELHPDVDTVDVTKKNSTKLGKQVRHIIRKMYVKISFNFRDYHYNNLGFHDNEVVCIDFDDFPEYDFQGRNLFQFPDREDYAGKKTLIKLAK